MRSTTPLLTPYDPYTPYDHYPVRDSAAAGSLTPRYQVEAAIARLEDHIDREDMQRCYGLNGESRMRSGYRQIAYKNAITILRAECAEILRGGTGMTDLASDTITMIIDRVPAQYGDDIAMAEQMSDLPGMRSAVESVYHSLQMREWLTEDEIARMVAWLKWAGWKS